MVRTRVSALAVVVAVSTVLVPSSAQAVPAGDRCSDRVRLDGFSDHLDETVVDGVPVAGLSAVAAAGDEVLALSDRSQLFTLDATREPTAVVHLVDDAGANLDSEGLAVDVDGTVWVSSETGPGVRRYTRDGALLESLPVPAALQDPPVGRATPNASFEGLTLSADGSTLVAAEEGPLAGDASTVVRFASWTRTAPDAAFTPAAQFAYPVDPGLGVSETTAVPDGRLLVLERGFVDQVGNTVRLYLVDPADAEQVDPGMVLDAAGAAAAVVTKTLLADFVTCPSAGAVAEQPQLNPLLDNIEGMTVVAAHGPRRLDVLLVSDDNERPTQTTRLYDLSLTLPVLATDG